MRDKVIDFADFILQINNFDMGQRPSYSFFDSVIPLDTNGCHYIIFDRS